MAATSMTDQFAQFIGPVARLLLGEPNRQQSTAKELRYGSRGSFAVNLTKGVWHDHETDEGGGLLDLIVRETRCPISDAPAWLKDHGFELDNERPRSNGPNGKKSQRRIDKIFPYVDLNGQLLFEVVRYFPKDFRQRKPDGKGGYVWKLQDIKLVPYHLPEIAEAIALDHTIFVVEGEKCVDLLWSYGIPATCNPMGAGKWTDDLTPYFASADVIVIGDYDPQKQHPRTKEWMYHDDGRPILPGQDHALKVAEALNVTASRVRVLDLAEHWDEIKPKNDIADWFATGASVELFHALVDHSVDWTPELTLRFPEPQSIPPLFPYKPRPFTQIPPRQWLHAKHYIRRHVVMTVAPGGYGKSSLLLLNAIELATGRGLIGPPPRERVRTAYWNAEEAEPEEIERRIAAICVAHNIDPKELDGWLFLGLKVSNDEFRFAGLHEGKIAPNADLIEKITKFILDNEIGVLILDPMVQFHRVQEIDTAAMESLVKDVLQPIAYTTNCCIELSHHTRKGGQNFGGAEITADDSRGAGAAINAARSVRVLNRMTKGEAETHGVKDEDRRLHLRISRDKTNMAPPGKARWMRLASIDIGNATATLPADNVQAATAWDYPKAFEGVTVETMHFMRAKVSKQSYRKDIRSPDWVGRPLLEHLGLNADDKGARSRVRAILDVWFDNGVLTVEQRHDGNRHKREYVIPGNWKDMEAESLQPSFLD
jgi:hypothetical protein